MEEVSKYSYTSDSKSFLDLLIIANNRFEEIRRKEYEYRKKNDIAWEEVEKQLTELHGDYRSKAYISYMTHSKYYIPLGEGLLNKIISGLTDNEKLVLKIK